MAAICKSWLNRFYPNCCTCFDTTAVWYPSQTATYPHKLSYFFQCPPTGPLPRIISFLVIFLVGWIILYLLIGGWAGVPGPIFSIVVLEMMGLFSGMGIGHACTWIPCSTRSTYNWNHLQKRGFPGSKYFQAFLPSISGHGNMSPWTPSQYDEWKLRRNGSQVLQ